MKYVIKSDGMVIYNKTTCRDLATNKIKYIDWCTGIEVEVKDGSIFTEEEKDFMLEHYKNLEVIEVG